MNAPARWLFAFARSLMPRERRDWWDAMRAEADHLPDAVAMRWACGCVYAAFQERLNMNTGQFRISRRIMLVETLGCFGFMTLAWFEITFGASGLTRHTPEIVSKYYLSSPGGPFVFAMIALGAVVGLVGPVGLYLGLRYVLSGRGLSSRRMAAMLIAAPIVYALASLAGYLVGPTGWHGELALGVMCVLLPIVGIFHLAWLEQPDPAAPAGGAAGLAVS